jgi:hypothetical protein
MDAILEKLRRSWQLFKRSIRVIRDHPKLLLFPLVMGAFTTVIALFFLVPVGVAVLAPHWRGGGLAQSLVNAIGFMRVQHGTTYTIQVQTLGAVILAGIYLLNMFLATMASVAFNHQIIEALNGRPVSIRRGIAAACLQWKAILFWSLLAGAVGLLIRALEERLAFVGRLIAGLIGVAWSVASLFVIPILARESQQANPFAILAKSAQIIKRTWGEMLTGYVGMQGMNILMLWASGLYWIGVGVSAFLLSNPWLLLIMGVPWLLALLTYGYLAGIASRVYLCALYLYAADGFVASHYEAAQMSLGWKLKKGTESNGASA